MIGRRRFSKTHEWVDFDTETKQGKLGITKYAADALGDIVHVDLPEDGDSFAAGESIVSAGFWWHNSKALTFRCLLSVQSRV